MSHNTSDPDTRRKMKVHYKAHAERERIDAMFVDLPKTPPISFHLTMDQSERAWMFEFGHKCSLDAVGAIGGAVTYQFTNTNLGRVCKVVCACGQEEDVSDYDEW